MHEDPGYIQLSLDERQTAILRRSAELAGRPIEEQCQYILEVMLGLRLPDAGDRLTWEAGQAFRRKLRGMK